MPVKILINAPENSLPEDTIRADVAWKLFLPDNHGDIPGLGKGRIEPIRHWLWWELSRKLGFLHPAPESMVYIAAPALTEAGMEFLVRTCSLWTNEVYAINGDGEFDLEETGKNLWTAPVVNIHDSYEGHSALGKLTEKTDEGEHTFFSPVLGASKAFIRKYTIKEGETYSRYHSHTAREELYLVMKGTGTIRIAGHSVQIREGDLVSKPTGPDISTQFLADRGEQLQILDIEIWQDDERKTKDLVHYPDHAELDLFGEGWNLMIPSDAIMGFEDAMNNYQTGYRRKIDGSWESKDIPGLKKREK